VRPATAQGGFKMHGTLHRGRSPSRRAVLVVVVIAACAAAALAAPAFATASTGGNQWIAKQYSEVLGRAAESAGWGFQEGKVYGSNCTLANLKDQGVWFFTTTEFQNRAYTNAQKIVALYRAILNRDPDQAGFNGWLAALNSGTPLTTIAGYFYDSTEFGHLLSRICGGMPYYWGNGDATFEMNANSTNAYGHVADGRFAGGTASALQTALNTARPCGMSPGSPCPDPCPSRGTVWLDRGAVITADATIEVPSCVTLDTYAVTNRKTYLQMGRIIRTTNFVGPVIQLDTNSTMNHVWIDGNRNQFEQSAQNLNPAALDYTASYSNTGTCSGATSGSSYPDDTTRNCMKNVAVVGDKVTVHSCRIQDPLGSTNLKVENGGQTETITNNLLLGYATSHYKGEISHTGLWADGISFDGTSSTISTNDIVDATDVGVVLFGNKALPDVGDTNTVVDSNNIMNAGNSASAAADFDPYLSADYAEYNYSGTSIQNNTVFTSLTAHYHIAFSAGTRAWFGTKGHWADSPTLTGNVVPSGRIIRTGIGIAVDGAYLASVTNNTLNLTLNSAWVNTACDSLTPTQIDYALDGSTTAGGSTAPTSNEVLYVGDPTPGDGGCADIVSKYENDEIISGLY
jgi:Domain of unknown function (DUF4214)